jgi:hypothetical protein
MIDDSNVDELNLDLHRVTVSRGTILYRIVSRGQNPLKPTGRACRFAKEPPHYTHEKYAAAVDLGTAILCGTGNLCFSPSVVTAQRETGSNMDGKEMYKITLQADISVVDIESICEAEKVAKPYIPEEQTELWHKFYGRGVNGLRYPSAKNHNDYNIVIFPDHFSDYRKVFLAEKL